MVKKAAQEDNVAKSNSDQDEEGKIEDVVEMVNPITFNSQTSDTLDAKAPLEIEEKESKTVAPEEKSALMAYPQQ